MPMKLRLLPANLLALLLANLSITFYLTGGGVGLALQASLALLAIPATLLLVLGQVDMAPFLKGLVYATLLSGIFLISILANLENYYTAHDILYAGGLVLSILFATSIAAILAAAPEEILHVALRRYALLGTLFLIFIILVETTPGAQRQMPAGIHPNWWGLQAFGIMAAALFLQKKSVRWAIWMVCLYMLYLVSARGALLGALVMMGMQVFSHFRKRRQMLLVAGTLLSTCTAMALIILLLPEVSSIQRAGDFIVYDVFLIDDSYRGLGTGLVGRLEGYLAALQEWLANPVFGIGYNNSRETHNGFLMILGETGLVGLGVFLFLLVRAIRNAPARLTNPQIIVMTGYIMVILTYPRAINVNTAALVFLFALWHELCRPRKQAS